MTNRFTLQNGDYLFDNGSFIDVRGYVSFDTCLAEWCDMHARGESPWSCGLTYRSVVRAESQSPDLETIKEC